MTDMGSAVAIARSAAHGSYFEIVSRKLPVRCRPLSAIPDCRTLRPKRGPAADCPLSS